QLPQKPNLKGFGFLLDKGCKKMCWIDQHICILT
ncbi:hypothetical protein E9W_06473, partial [Moraxella catarrhalis CO72]